MERILMKMAMWQLAKDDCISVLVQKQLVLTSFPTVLFEKVVKISTDFDGFDNTCQ